MDKEGLKRVAGLVLMVGGSFVGAGRCGSMILAENSVERELQSRKAMAAVDFVVSAAEAESIKKVEEDVLRVSLENRSDEVLGASLFCMMSGGVILIFLRRED